MITLALDASTAEGSVAVFDGERVVATREVAMRGRDEERLLPAVADALASASLGSRDVQRIVCGGGPGSFTSLRIAASIAKGLAVALDAPLFAVPSLALVVAANAPAVPAEYLVVADALRGEFFAQGVRVTGSTIEVLGPVTLVREPVMPPAGVLLVGAGGEPSWKPHARGALRLLGPHPEPLRTATWEPDYGRKAEAQVKWEAAHNAELPG